MSWGLTSEANFVAGFGHPECAQVDNSVLGRQGGSGYFLRRYADVLSFTISWERLPGLPEHQSDQAD